ncbi:tyrosine-type recombinase/integrase [Frankia sp. EI5c]|uniref:tyrosine-type recombinase/integrase n=1 Tax=Frankia sp. EI5c TaxID=683316 RepID=UPI001F5B49A8|nr:tyrosine-type recombinase/integrase [Frankia sp. EI5c]
MSGTRARLTLAAPLPVDVEVGAELGGGLLSRRRLHDLRHSSASIQLAEGVDLALVSKRLGHSSPSITGSLYVHLLRSSGQKAAETVAAAVPRSTRRGHPVGTGPVEASGEIGPGSVAPGQGPIEPHVIVAEDERFELSRGCPQHAFQVCAPPSIQSHHRPPPATRRLAGRWRTGPERRRMRPRPRPGRGPPSAAAPGERSADGRGPRSAVRSGHGAAGTRRVPPPRRRASRRRRGAAAGARPSNHGRQGRRAPPA